jgi:hypothetical protein
MTGSEHNSALRRLDVAMEDQDRSRARYQAAIGTSSELSAYTRLSAANEQVAARGAWLAWVDDENYRGVHAGPFSLRAETDDRGHSAEKPPLAQTRPLHADPERAVLPRNAASG